VACLLGIVCVRDSAASITKATRLYTAVLTCLLIFFILFDFLFLVLVLWRITVYVKLHVGICKFRPGNNSAVCNIIIQYVGFNRLIWKKTKHQFNTSVWGPSYLSRGVIDSRVGNSKKIILLWPLWGESVCTPTRRLTLKIGNAFSTSLPMASTHCVYPRRDGQAESISSISSIRMVFTTCFY